MRTIAVVPVSWMLVVAALALWALPCQADGPFSYYPLTPCRLADTRKPNGPSGGPILQTGQDRAFPVQGLCGVPSGAKAVWVNVTAVQPTGEGDLILYASGTTRPLVSSLHFHADEYALGNGSIVALGTSSMDLAVYAFVAAPPGQVHMVLDVSGYFQ